MLLETNISNNCNVSIDVQLEEILPENAYLVFLEYATQKDYREPTFAHYRIMTIDWSW